MQRSLKGLSFSILLVLSQLLAGAGKASGAELEPIVVRRALSGEPVTAALNREDIDNIPANSPEELLNYLGVDIQSRGFSGIKSDISLNASTFQQVLILVNGLRINDPQTAHHDLDLFFNIEDIERIEIIPAAASSKYGPNGIGGAINFVLKKPKAEKNSISAAGGNLDTYEQKLNLSSGMKNFTNRFSASNIESDGSRYDMDFRTNTFFYSALLELEDASLSLDTGYNEKEFGAYDFYTPAKGYASKEWINTKFLDLRGTLEGAEFTFEPRLSFRQHYDKFMLDIRNPDLYLNHHRTDAYQAGGILTFPLSEGKLSIGADYAEENIASNNLGKHDRGNWALYLDSGFGLAQESSLNLSLRVDGYTAFSEELTGSVSLRHAINDKSGVYLMVGRSIRVPTFTELYYSDPTTAGDASLGPESAINLQAGIERELTEALDCSFSFFVRQEYDTIDFTKLTASDAKFIARNISEATTEGLNLFLKWRLNDATSMDAGYFYANKRLKDNGKIYKYGLSHLKHMATLGLDSRFSFGRNRFELIVKKKPGRRAWALANDKFSYELTGNIELFFEVYNLFNVEYQEIEGIPEQKRMFKFGTKFTW